MINPRTRNWAIGASFFVGVILTEGWTDHAVIPVPGDVPTIGPGRTGPDVKMGDTTTVLREMPLLLKNLEKKYGDGVRNCVTVPLHQREFDALVDAAYNAGVGGVCRDIAPKFNAAKTDEDYAEACKSFIGWRETVKGKSCRDPKNKCSGLVKRREAEYRQCMGLA
jgi:lysozyme